MKRIPIKIGEKQFKFKKDALLYFKNILNSYKFGDSLSENDLKDVSALVNKKKYMMKKLK